MHACITRLPQINLIIQQQIQTFLFTIKDIYFKWIFHETSMVGIYFVVCTSHPRLIELDFITTYIQHTKRIRCLQVNKASIKSFTFLNYFILVQELIQCKIFLIQNCLHLKIVSVSYKSMHIIFIIKYPHTLFIEKQHQYSIEH